MWRQVFDKNGNKVGQSSTDAFFNELRKPHTPSVMVQLLDTDFIPVEGGTIFSAEATSELTNFISDGSIDVDRTRGTRRTGELTLLNPTAEFTPATGDFESEGEWVGKIYLNRMLRVYRGLYHSGRPLYVPVGTFFVDIADVMLEQNMSLVNLTMSDRWKMLTKSYLGGPKEYERDTRYNEIIRDLIDAAGVPMSGRWGAVIDSLGSRDAEDRRTNGRIKFERGDSRGDKLKELCGNWGIDAYFDPMGVFRTEDRRAVADKQTVWHYYTSVQADGMLVSLRRSFNDDNLYNHVVIIGTGDPKNIVKAFKADHSATSKTSVERIGDRVYLKESSRISTQAEADRALARAWAVRFQLSEQIEMQAICNPALEADDNIRITERDFIKIDEKYRLTRFNVPLVTTLQTAQCMNILKKEDL